MTALVPGCGSEEQGPLILLDASVTLLTCHTDQQLAYGYLTSPGSPTWSDHIPTCHMPSQNPHCCTDAATSDTEEGLQDIITRTTVILHGLQPCSIRTYHASQHWWQYLIQHIWDHEQWMDAFRMTQTTFLDLLQQLWLHLECQDTGMHPALHTKHPPGPGAAQAGHAC
ncbi:hypothetical protein Y1Q_0023005 [Alligator mississippiensis]|uniref:Uncharacterized protein n=1 Tax=Alligator mississippiensis TaxID=8496 RepID=A0A151P795_ALLMI|nr:hypothetical protein Y1Q_0023005 [Alligator mississippiensis]